MAPMDPVVAIEHDDDRLLAARCVGGERSAQHELFHAHKKRVRATLYRVLGAGPSMEDLVQDVFLTVFRSLATFRAESSLATWIDRCTVRTAYAWMGRRRARVPQRRLEADVAADGPSTEQRALAREATQHLYAALDGLEPRLRLAFILHAFDGRPLTEVASLMDASVQATKTRVFRARHALAECARKDPVLAPFVGAGSGVRAHTRQRPARCAPLHVRSTRHRGRGPASVASQEPSIDL